MAGGLTWQTGSPSTMAKGLDTYGRKLMEGVWLIGETISEAMQEMARRDATWTDHTRAARDDPGLTAYVEKLATGVVMYLAGLAPHNIFLELGTVNMDPQPIILPVLEAHYPITMQYLRRLVR